MFIIRFLLLIFHLGIWALLCLCLLNEWFSPKVLTHLNFLSLAFPFLVMSYLLLTGIWIAQFRKRAYFFLFSFVLFFNPTRRWLNFSTEKKATKKSIKVISFNVHNGEKDYKNIRNYLSEQDADVILLQESSYDPKISDLQLNSYQKPLIYPVVSLISKYPVLKTESLLDPTQNGHSFYADIEINGQIIRFINVYLEPFSLDKTRVLEGLEDLKSPENKELERKMSEVFKLHATQVGVIHSWVKKSPYPIVLAADANSVPNSYEYFQLCKGLKDGFLEAGNGLGTSFHEWKFPIRIDYIFGSEKINFLDYSIDKSIHLSDHFPVMSRFEIKN